MERSNETTTRALSLPRWSLLILSVLLPLVLLSVGLAGAERLAPDAEVFGRVVNPDGSTITGDTVAHLYQLDEWGYCCAFDIWTDVPSIGGGNFSFTETIPSAFLPGTFFVQAEAPETSPYFESVPKPVFIASDIAIVPAGDISLTYASFGGIVFEPDGYTFADGGDVTVEEVLDHEWRPVAWGDYLFGDYAVGGVPAGEFWLVAHPPEDSLFWDSEPISVTILPGSQYERQTQYIDLFLQDPNITGTVVYPDGSPVTWVMSDTDVIGYAKAVAEKQDGTLTIDRMTASAGDFGMLLPDGDYWMWAEPEGTIAMAHTQSLPRPINVPAVADTGPMTLTYPSFAGLIYDPAENPILECVDVWLEDMSGEAQAIDWYCGYEEMLYHLGGAAAGDYLLMSGGLPELGLFPATPIPVSVLPGSQYDIDATQYISLYLNAPQLSVYVEDPIGRPIPGHVVLWDDWGLEIRQSATPDQPALFGALEPGEYWIQAWPIEQDIPELANSRQQPVLIGLDQISRTLRLRLPDVIGVVETPEGDPLPQAYDWEGNPVPHPAEVHVHNWDWSVDIGTTTNISGEFSLALPPDDYELVAMPMWDLNERYTKSPPIPFFTDALPPPEDLGYIQLTYPRIEGVVVDPLGNRVSTWVNMWNEDGSYWDGDETLWYPPDEEKPFRFGGMPLDHHYFVQADPPWDNPEGFGVSNIYEFDVPPTSTERITLELTIANIVGNVRFPRDFEPCPECPVPWVDVRVRTENWELEQWAYTGEDGRFAFTWPITVPSLIEVFLPPEMLLDWDPPLPLPFTLQSPEERILPTLHLRYPLCIQPIDGIVSYGDGAPVDDALVFAYHEDTGLWFGTPTQPDGFYEFCLDPGLWTLGVEPVYPDVDWFFDPADEQLLWVPFTETKQLTRTVDFGVTRFTEGDFIQVTGVVTTPNAAPVPSGVWVDICNDEGRCFGGPVEPNGDFMFYALPGPYHLWVDVDPTTGLRPPLKNGMAVFVDADTPPLGPLYLRALGDRTARVSGRVIVSSTGKGLAGVPMEAWTDEGDWNTAKTASDGRYTISLFPGNWHAGPALWLSPTLAAKYVVLPPELEHGHLEAGETISNVNFILQRRDATIRGQVVISGTTTPITDVQAIVFAERCGPHGRCWIAGEADVRGGTFELKVVGGLSYTLGIWLWSPGYMPAPPPDPVFVGPNKTVSGVRIKLIEAGTEIHGYLLDGDTGAQVMIEASIYGSDSEGKYWVEDYLWPEKDPYTYNLYVPTPETKPVTWTLGLWVPPSSGYIADPAHPHYEVVVNPNDTSVFEIMYVQMLDTVISGTVTVGTLTGDPAPFIWVFAEGAEGTDSEGLYFEAMTDRNGEFSMLVLPGEYLVSAYLPPELVDTFFPPLPRGWASPDDNPVQLVFRPIPTGVDAIQICGDLDVFPAGALADDTQVPVLGWAEDGSTSEVTGTLAGGYCMDVIPKTTWYVWAAYEDTANDAFYRSQEKRVNVRDASVDGVDLTLLKAPFDLPDPICVTFDPSKNKRISLPAPPELFEPLIDIPAGAMPVTGNVEVCATPRGAVPNGLDLLGFAYELEARDKNGNRITQDFNKKVRLTFYFNAAMVGDITAEDIQPVFYSTTRNEWVALDDPFVDLEDYFATGKTNHFSMFGALSTPLEEHKIYLPLIIK